MSLIFEALKKLEREKESPDRGVVVVAPGAWGEREPRPRGRTLAALLLVVLGLAVGAFALRPRAGLQAPAPPPAAASAPPASMPTIPISDPPLISAVTGVPPPPPRLVLPTVAPPPKTAEAAAPESEPTAVPAAPQPEFRLNAISTREGHPVALLNDRLVREGDMIEGVRIVHIGEDYVEIEVKGERRTIRF